MVSKVENDEAIVEIPDLSILDEEIENPWKAGEDPDRDLSSSLLYHTFSC
jgi:hypothetical protein